MASTSVASAVYSFEGLLPDLESPPIAARRALDRSGLRLSIEAWRSLGADAREELTAAGVATRVDAARIASIVAAAKPPAVRVEPLADPDAAAAPEDVVRALEPGVVIGPARWARLRAVDRYALVHAHRRAVARSALSDLAEAAECILARAAEGDGLEDAEEPERQLTPTPHSPGVSYTAKEAPPSLAQLSSHLTDTGEVHMVDVARKPQTHRRAVARGAVLMHAETLERLVNREAPKGEVLGTARLAAIMAAKRTFEIVPLCHIVALTHIDVALEPRAVDAVDPTRGAVDVTATVEAYDRTGCEMEALVAVTTACLTVYDMLKGIDRGMVISNVELLEKSGGRSGHYQRPTWRGDP